MISQPKSRGQIYFSGAENRDWARCYSLAAAAARTVAAQNQLTPQKMLKRASVRRKPSSRSRRLEVKYEGDDVLPGLLDQELRCLRATSAILHVNRHRRLRADAQLSI